MKTHVFVDRGGKSHCLQGIGLVWLWFGMILASGCFGQTGMFENDRPPVINDDVKRTANSNNQFGDNLYLQLAQEPGNLFFSPASISSALSMVWGGAELETADEIKSTLGIQLDEAKHHAANGELVRLLNAQGKGYEMRLANRLWGQHNLNFHNAFLNVMLNDYRAPLGKVDFENNLEGSRKQINAWVEQQTKNRIRELFEPGILDGDTRLVLVNAIYFKADWQMPFNKSATRDSKFRLDAAKEVTVSMMYRTDDMHYGESDDAKILRLPYANQDLTMTVVLPKTFGSIGEVEKRWLGSDSPVSKVKLSKREVQLQLPRFKVESEFRLDAVLKQLGLIRAFSDSAQFGRMTTEANLMIGAVVHKAFVEVNEEGTEAAAATGVGMKMTSAPVSEPVTFHVDQPFLFFIRHEPSGAVLFAGRVVNPLK